MIDLNAAPYNCGPGQSPADNRDAIAAAIAASPPCGSITWDGPITVAPGSQAYIYFEKGLTLDAGSWSSQIIPDPAIPSTLPVVYAKGVPAANFFNVILRNFQIGDPYAGPREGGAGVRIEADTGGAGTENSGLDNVFIAGGKYGSGSFGVELIHSTPNNPGPIYNFTIDRCEILGGVKGVQVADSVRIERSLFWGDNAIDIDCRPTEGKFTFRGNNVSTAAGFRLRAGNAPSIRENIFTQQVIGTGPYNALVDFAGDLGPIRAVDFSGNRVHKEADVGGVPITTRLMRCDNVDGILMSHNDFANPLTDTPIEFTANCWNAKFGLNTWALGGSLRFVNNNPASSAIEVVTALAVP